MNRNEHSRTLYDYGTGRLVKHADHCLGLATDHLCKGESPNPAKMGLEMVQS